VRRLISRTAVYIVSVSVALGVAAVPCAAGDTTASNAEASLTRLSPASHALLVASPRTDATASSKGEQPAAGPTTPNSFFKSTRGKITLALMGAGAGFAVWSIHHDRIPVKSPVR
jgi:hypothetical protein